MTDKTKIDDGVSQAIARIITDMMDQVMDRVLQEDPFIPEKHRAAKPLYAALVPDEIFKGSHFERRFVTPFGKVWQKLAEAVAKGKHDDCQQEVKVEGTIKEERIRRIHETLNKLEKPGRGKNKLFPDWDNELRYILAGGGKKIVPESVTCDLLINSKIDGKVYSFELKAPLPNSDQTKVSKEKIFKLLAMEQNVVDEAYFALPYNPYGSKECYAWSFPFRWFDMKHDPCVLIGNEFWNLIGGEGSYESFISSVNALGEEYRERIFREYLGIEPPQDNDLQRLK